MHKFWDFGNGSATHDVSLTVTDANGCVDETAQVVEVTESPHAELIDLGNFPPFTNCVNGSEFTLTVQNASYTQATNAGYSIDWGDGTIDSFDASFTEAAHTYSQEGIWYLVFIVEGSNGCSSEKEYAVYNGSSPVFGIASDAISGCVPFTVELTIDNSAFENSPNTIYYFDFGDGSPPLQFSQEELISVYPDGIIEHTYFTGSCFINDDNAYTIYTFCENPCEKLEYWVTPIHVSTEVLADFNRFPI